MKIALELSEGGFNKLNQQCGIGDICNKFVVKTSVFDETEYTAERPLKKTGT
jgi:hypothetical protein